MLVTRKLLLKVAVILVSIIGLFWLLDYLGHGTLVVSVQDENSEVLISRVDEPSDESTQSRGSQKLKLKTGRYSVKISTPTSALEKIIEIKSRQTSTIDVPMDEVGGVQYVYRANIRSPHYFRDSIVYINDSDQLVRVDGDGSSRILSAQGQSVYFAEYSDRAGLILLQEDGQTTSVYYLGNNDSLSKVRFSGGEQTPIGSASLDSDGKFVVAIGRDVYYFDSPASGEKIYTLDSDTPVSLSLAKNKLYINSSAHSETGPPQDPKIQVIDLATKNVATIETLAETLVPSPNGDRAVYFDQSLLFLGQDTLSKRQPILANVSKVEWVDDNRFVYVTADEIWMHDVSSELSRKLASTPLGAPVASLEIDRANENIYFSVNPEVGVPVLYKVGYGDSVEKRNKNLEELQKVMPILGDGYIIDLINITVPTISVRSSEAMRGDALNDLRRRGVDLGAFRVIEGLPD